MRLGRVAAACGALLALSGCQTGIRVGVDANDHGGGRVVAVVTLDKDAQKLVGDLESQLRVDDLKKAGWTIDGPKKVGTDLRITATKPFSSADGVRTAVRELDGGKGLFENFRVSQQRSLFRTSTSFSGTVDLRKGIEAFSDETLERELGSPLGATPSEFATRIGRFVANSVPNKVSRMSPCALLIVRTT